MQTINHRQFHKKPKKRRLTRRGLLRALAVAAIIFVGANLGMAFIYRDKALPGTRLGDKNVGGMTYSQIENLRQADLLPAEVVLSKDDKSIKKSPNDLGFTVDLALSADNIGNNKTLVPLFDIIVRRQVDLVTKSDPGKFESEAADLAIFFSKAALDKRVVFDSGFKVANPEDGYELDKEQFSKIFKAAVLKGKNKVAVPTKLIKPEVHDVDLSGEVSKLTKQVSTKVSLTVDGGAKLQPTGAEKASWFVPEGQTMVTSSQKIGEYLDQLAQNQGYGFANRDDLTTALAYALTRNLVSDFRVVTQGHKVLAYCTAAKGVSEAELTALNGKLAATYADIRGWGNGLIAFKHATSGCSFTVWLSAPKYMTSFGAICDTYYNCQVGTNVIANYDRWAGATAPWLDSGRNLEEYRALLINHETGHRLGFPDNNPTCTQPGQLAPVMMQQSLSLNGCQFNAWPLPSELNELAGWL